MAFNFLKSLDADDIFISYSREDGSAYLTGLDTALATRGFSCFTDKRGTDAGRLPPETLFRKIRLCKTLVLLATPGALKNPENMAMEVSEFAKANGTSRILCVSFDRGAEFANWSGTPWYAHIEGKERGREDPNALTTGEPSPSIVDNIVRASDYMKSKDRLRRYRNRALAGFLCLLALGVAAGGFALYQLRRAGEEKAMSDSRSLANRSQILLRQHPEALPRALALAVSAMNESSAIGVHGVEADSALRDSLALLPHLRSSEKYDRGAAAVAFSPDGRHFAMLSSDNKLRIYDALSQTPLQARKPLRDLDCECSAVALSSGLAYAAAVTAKGIQVFDLQDGAHSHLVKLESGVSAEKIALSPGGRYLALFFNEGEDVGRLSKMMVLETAHHKLIKTFDNLHMLIHDIEFGPSGNLAAGGKDGSPQGGRFTGRVILWSLSLKSPGSNAELELTDASFGDTEEIPQQGEVNAVAPGTDSTYFATDRGIWKRLSGRMDYEPIARFPYVRDFPSESWIGSMSFRPDGQSLVLARSIEGKDQGPTENALEAWDLPWHWDLAHAFQPREVISMGFKPGEPLVAVMTGQPTQEEPIRVFRAANGEPVDSIAFEPETEGREEKYASLSKGTFVHIGQKVVVAWDVWSRRRRTAVFGDVLRSVEVAAVSPGGKFLALSGPNKESKPALFVFRLEHDSYRKWKSIPRADEDTPEYLSTNGQRLVVLNSYTEQYRVWDVSDGRDVSPASLAKAGDVSHMALSPGGRFLALADLGDRAQLLDLSQGRKSKLIPLLDATSIRSLAFSSDERYLGLGSDEGILYVFDTFRPEDEIARLQHTGAITAMAFSDDNRYLATASSDPHPYHLDEEESFPLRIWLLQPGDLIAEARRRLAPFSK
jgi:WD40 repeat protein